MHIAVVQRALHTVVLAIAFNEHEFVWGHTGAVLILRRLMADG